MLYIINICYILTEVWEKNKDYKIYRYYVMNEWRWRWRLKMHPMFAILVPHSCANRKFANGIVFRGTHDGAKQMLCVQYFCYCFRDCFCFGLVWSGLLCFWIVLDIIFLIFFCIFTVEIENTIVYMCECENWRTMTQQSVSPKFMTLNCFEKLSHSTSKHIKIRCLSVVSDKSRLSWRFAYKPFLSFLRSSDFMEIYSSFLLCLVLVVGISDVLVRFIGRLCGNKDSITDQE